MASTKLPRTPENVRKVVLADPNTAKIAEKLGVKLEDYVEQVVQFVLNPQAEPSLYIVEDDDLRAQGMEPPDPEAMGRYLIEAAEVANAAGATEYTDPKKKLVAMQSSTDLDTVGEEHTDPKLKQELDKALKAKRGGNR